MGLSSEASLEDGCREAFSSWDRRSPAHPLLKNPKIFQLARLKTKKITKPQRHGHREQHGTDPKAATARCSTWPEGTHRAPFGAGPAGIPIRGCPQKQGGSRGDFGRAEPAHGRRLSHRPGRRTDPPCPTEPQGDSWERGGGEKTPQGAAAPGCLPAALLPLSRATGLTGSGARGLALLLGRGTEMRPAWLGREGESREGVTCPDASGGAAAGPIRERAGGQGRIRRGEIRGRVGLRGGSSPGSPRPGDRDHRDRGRGRETPPGGSGAAVLGLRGLPPRKCPVPSAPVLPSSIPPNRPAACPCPPRVPAAWRRGRGSTKAALSSWPPAVGTRS